MFEDVSLADLRMMFDSTIVRYDGEPVYIHNVDADFKSECLFLGNHEYKHLNIRDKKFDFSPVPLGYVNVRGQAVYTYRNPLRKFKQGLHFDCLRYSLLGDDFLSEDCYVDVQKQIKSLKAKCLYNTIKGVYPCLEDVISSFEDKVRMAAFDRQFALRSDGVLYYRGKKVGGVSLKNGQIALAKDKQYLMSALGNKYEYR